MFYTFCFWYGFVCACFFTCECALEENAGVCKQTDNFMSIRDSCVSSELILLSGSSGNSEYDMQFTMKDFEITCSFSLLPLNTESGKFY